MPSNFKVSNDVDTFLRSADKAAMRSNIGAASGSTVDGLATDVATNTSNISTNTDNINTNSNDISTNATNIATNTSNISTNTSNINTNTNDIATKAPSASPTFTGTTTFNGSVDFDDEATFNNDISAEGATFNDEVELAGGAEISAGSLGLTDGGDVTLSGGNGKVVMTSSGKLEIGDLELSESDLSTTSGELMKLADDERTLVDQGDNTSMDWTSHDAVNFPLSTAKVGIRKSSPTSALDVNGTIKANSINVNSQKFYVDPNDDYIKASEYGSGNFATLTGSENQPKSTPAFGSGGKVVENTQIKTFKIVGSGFVGLGNTPVVIVTKAGAGKYIVPQRMTVYNDYGTRSGDWGSNNAEASIQIGTFQNSDNTGNFAPLLTIPQSTAETNGDWLSHKTIRNAEVKQFANRDLVLKSKNNIATEANAPDGAWYVRLEYMIIGESAGFENNIDQTIGTPFS